MGKDVAIVIPSNVSSLSVNEKISLNQVKNVLGKYDMFFILPDSLAIDYACNNIMEKRYPDECFTSIRMYSKFMLEEKLYEDFIEYDYILIYQLDAFVFRDQVRQFCNLGYDYIGAPWTKGVFYKKNETEKIWYVGNGGFSLRRVSSFIKFIQGTDLSQWIDFINEDVLIAAYGAPILHIASIEDSVFFSFDTDFEGCMKLTKGQLPFGCHGWTKHDYNLWKRIIEGWGYVVENPKEKEFDIVKQNEYMVKFGLGEFTQCKFMECFPLFKISDRGIYIWGAGAWGITLMYKLQEAGFQVAGFIDNDLTKCGKDILSHKIVDSGLLKEREETVIVANQKYYSQIKDKLQELHYRKDINFICIQDIWNRLMKTI